MGNLCCLKLGAIDGASALIVVIALAISLVAICAVVILNIVKAVKERKDAVEDQKENEFFAEYGITGEEMRLNQKLTDMRHKLISNKRIKEQLLDEQHIVVVHDRTEVQVEVPVETVVETPVETPVEEPVVQEEPVAEPIKEEVAEQPVQEEPTAEPITEEPVKEESVEEEPVKEEPAPAPAKEEPTPVSVEDLKPIKKEENWSNYDGEYEGVYYDPEDACYYEGTPSPELAKRLEEYQAELEKKSKKGKQAVIVKKVVPPFVALKTPKNERKTPEIPEGFDLSIIYGKYVIEHANKPDGTTEYFYTLYDPRDKALYESSNYSELDYCQRAIARFQSHVLIGEYSIESENGKYFFVLRRKSYVHKGIECNTLDSANELVKQVKYYAQTDIIRQQ